MGVWECRGGGVWSEGFRGFAVWGVGCRVQDLGCRAESLGSRV